MGPHSNTTTIILSRPLNHSTTATTPTQNNNNSSSSSRLQITGKKKPLLVPLLNRLRPHRELLQRSTAMALKLSHSPLPPGSNR
jgi:hypothetical protein